MSTYLLEISPDSSLPQIEASVAAEEAGAVKFVSSSISFHDGRITNLATFETLPPGTVPKHLHFLKADDPAPANTTPGWAGVMVVSGTTTAVATYRDT